MDQDQISHLHSVILHDILSRMPEKDAARMSLLSKTWAETWSTFPILSFSDTKIKGKDFVRKRKEFLDYVRKTFLRFRDQSLAIKEFKLSLDNLPYKSRVINLLTKLACESGVEVLELHLPTEQYYMLPRFVLEAKSLNKLVLNGGQRVYLPFLNHSIKFFSLRVLSLYIVFFEDHNQAIQNLISCCPLIEHIYLKFDYLVDYDDEGNLLLKIFGMKSLDMRGLPKLKEVDIQGAQEVYIDSPNLENLLYIPIDTSIPCKMDFNGGRNLRGLNLYGLPGITITSKWFLELFIKAPFLESLILDHCTMSQRIDISSGQLKVLEFLYCFNLEEANIDAPKLLSCVYRCHVVSKPIISFLKSSSQLEVKVWIYIDYPDLRNLRKIIQNFRSQNVISLSLFICRLILVEEGNLYVLQVSPPLQSIKHLHLSARPKEESFYFSFVSSLLSSCAATISLSLDTSYWSRAFIEIFYEALMGTKEDFCCHLTKCWCHNLKDFRVTNSKTDEEVDFKTMLDTLPARAAVKNISFRLEF